MHKVHSFAQMDRSDLRILVSGASSGLGKYIKEEMLGSDKYIRKTNSGEYKENYDLIIHAAFGQKREDESESEYIKYHTEIYKTLSNVSHKKLVFISSIDAVNANNNSYGKAKRHIEQMVLEDSQNNLIVRPGLLIGSGMKYNTVARLFTEQRPNFTLSKKSYFYITHYQEVVEFALSKHYGIWTVCSKQNLSLDEMAKDIGCTPRWGSYEYRPQIEDPYSKYHMHNDGRQKMMNQLKVFFKTVEILDQKVVISKNSMWERAV